MKKSLRIFCGDQKEKLKEYIKNYYRKFRKE